jgi:hypothetical protein
MANEIQLIEEREKGPIDISIGTALGIQAAMGLTEEGYPILNNGKPIEAPIKKYGVLLFNARTLFRNLYTVLEKEIRLKVSARSIVDVMLTEMRIIDSIVQRFSDGKTEVVYYACNYNGLTRLFPKALFKEVNTDLQKIYANMENTCIDLFSEALKEEGREFHIHDTQMPGLKKNTLIVTHYPIDLLWHDKYPTLDLLETHTGVIKRQAQWNTKLKNGSNLDRIPFDKMTIQFFGDTGGLLSPYPIKYRKALIEIAEKNKWNTLTTKGRILLTVKLARIHDLEVLVRTMYA